MLLHSIRAPSLGSSCLIVSATVFLVASLSPGAAHAQLFGSEAAAHDCAAAIGGSVTDSSVTVVRGMPHEQVAAPVSGLTFPDPAAKSEALELLRARLPGDTQFRLEAIAKLFEILGREAVEAEKFADTFARISVSHTGEQSGDTESYADAKQSFEDAPEILRLAGHRAAGQAALGLELANERLAKARADTAQE